MAYNQTDYIPSSTGPTATPEMSHSQNDDITTPAGATAEPTMAQKQNDEASATTPEMARNHQDDDIPASAEATAKPTMTMAHKQNDTLLAVKPEMAHNDIPSSAEAMTDKQNDEALAVKPEMTHNQDNHIPASTGVTAKPTMAHNQNDEASAVKLETAHNQCDPALAAATAKPENDIAVKPEIPEIAHMQKDGVVEGAKPDITHSQNNNPSSVATAAAGPCVHATTPTPSQTPHVKSKATPAQSPGSVAAKSPRPNANATKTRASPRDTRMGFRTIEGMRCLFGIKDVPPQPQSAPASHYRNGITASDPTAQCSPKQPDATPPPTDGSQAVAPSDPTAGQCNAPTVESIRQLFSAPPAAPPPEAAEGSDATDVGCPGNATSEAAHSTHAHKPMSKCQPSATLLQRSIVHDLDGMFDFWDFSFDKMVDGMSEDERLDTWERLARSLEDDSLSTAYSGVRAPETAMSVMRYRLGLRLGREVKCNNHNLSHAIEWSPDAQAECLLSARHEGGGCVFGNIADFFRSELKDSVIPQLLAKPAMTLEVLQPLLRTNRLEIVYFMAWLGLRMLLQEPDVTQENVVGFPPDVIEQAVSSIYYMEVCELDAVQFGCACARRRQFIRLRHKEKVLGEISPLARFSTRFFRAVKYHWYFYRHKILSDLPVKNELLQELEWACRRPTSQAVDFGLDQLEPSDVLRPEVWLAALNTGEESIRSSYELVHPNQVWALNQNPATGFANTSTDRHLQTIIANLHMLWTQHSSVVPARWLMGSEALVTQAFPIVPGLWGVSPDDTPVLCSFNLPREGRTSRSMMAQAGNSMNIIVMTVVSLHGLLSYEQRQLPDIVANIRLSRRAMRTVLGPGCCFWLFGASLELLCLSS
ncbi:unnamed protein product [Symbiodinium sp. CCMP2592]|nr:unnamed protein product [Symbiodinium sp. CCMP2592]